MSESLKDVIDAALRLRLQALKLSSNPRGPFGQPERLTMLPPEIGQMAWLQSLDVSQHRLTTLPPEIEQLTSLQSLDVSENKLTTLPPEIGLLTSLQSLDVSQNKLTTLPPEIGQLTSLQSFEVSENELTTLPPEIGQLMSLQTLDLSNNALTGLPPEIGRLKELQIVMLRRNRLIMLPLEIGQLAALQSLNLIGNRLTTLPPEIAQLPVLQSLNLSENELTALPPETWQLTALEALDLSSNRLTALSLEMVQLTGLQTLDLSGNRLATLPPEIAQLTALRTLDLSGNQLTTLPPEIAQLTALQSLDVSGNQLTTLPPQIAQLTALKSLNLSGNRLIALPPEIGQMTALQNLFLGQNQLTALPREIGRMAELQVLFLRRNRLTVLPPEIGHLTALQTLDLGRNRLTTLPAEIGLLRHMQTARRHHAGIWVDNNPLPDPYPLIARSQPSATVNVLAWLRGELDPLTLVSSDESSDSAENDLLSSDELREVAKQLQQNPIGARFEQRGNYLAIASSGYASDFAAAEDPITQQLHSYIQLKAKELAECALRISNVPGWQALPGATQRFQELIGWDLRHVVAHIGPAWAELVSLGSFLEQDNQTLENSQTFIEPLPLDVRRSLVDLIQTAGPWLRRFPGVQKLDEEHASFQTPRDKIPSARIVLTAAKDGKIVLADDAAILDDALDAGERSGHQSSKARNYGIFSVRNVAIGAAAFAAWNLAEGAIKHIGEEVSKDSTLAHKSVTLILKSEEALLRFLDDLPADIRAAVKTLIEDFKKRSGQPEFPLPKAPHPEHNDPAKKRRTKEKEGLPEAYRQGHG
jgi:Leucine-rich repeat (LRR) protein